MKKKPTIEVKTDRYNDTKSIPILYLSPKNALLDNLVDNKIEKVVNSVVNPIEALKNLKDNTADFFEAGERYEVDSYLLMAVAILESGGGQSVPPDSFNPFGRVCGKGYDCVSARDATTEKSLRWIKFESWKEAIFDEAKYLKEHYYDLGFNTIELIGSKYAEDKNWAKKIRAIISKIKD